MNAQIEIQHLLPVWDAFRNTTDIAPIRDEAHYRHMVLMLEALLNEVGGDEHHPGMGLVDIIGDLIENYEAEHYPLPEATGVQALEFLMAQHGLKPSELAEIGNEDVVREILMGKRELDIHQIRALGKRFGVSTATFV